MRKLWVLLLVALVACAPKANENTEKAQGDNLMRYARNIVVYEKDYGYRVLTARYMTCSLGSMP